MEAFLPLGAFYVWNGWNVNCREGFGLKKTLKQEFLVLDISMIFFLPKIGNFQMLLVSKGIHGNQVIQRFLVVQTLLYWNQLKPLAQNCPKNYYLHSSTGLLCSNLATISILPWFDGKIAK